MADCSSRPRTILEITLRSKEQKLGSTQENLLVMIRDKYLRGKKKMQLRKEVRSKKNLENSTSEQLYFSVKNSMIFSDMT